MKTRIRTPQEKKALSLARDRRNMYRERGANSRFAIARHKAKDLRRVRRRENEPLGVLAGALSDDELAQAQLRAMAHPRRSWKKCPDRPLRQAIQDKLERRAAIAAAGGRRRARG
jgi:hypothetical protein